MADKTINWGLIGASNIAKSYVVDAIRNEPNAAVAAVYSRSASHGQRFADELQIPNVYSDLNELLSSPNIDAVYISSTNELHCAQAIAAAKAVQHILCEKPLALNTKDAVAMVEAAKSANVIMATNHHLRNAALHQTLAQLVQSGELGEIHSVRVNHGVFLPEFLQTWRVKDDLGGGVILDISVHDADTLRFILGQDPIAVSGMVNQNPLETNVMSVWQFADGLLAQVHEGFTTEHAQTSLELHGTKASAIATHCLTQNSVGDIAIQRRNDQGQVICTPVEIQHHNLYFHGLEKFHNAIATKGLPAATGEDGVKSLTIALALKQAVQEQRTVTIDYPLA